MESRRLAILCSHIRPSSGPAPTRQFPVSRSNCDAGGLDTNEQPSEGSHRNDCVFCKIITGESPAFKLYEDDICLCILDTNPLSRGALDCLWASESLRRRPLNIDQEASRLADRVREHLSLSYNSEDSKGEGSSLAEN